MNCCPILLFVLIAADIFILALWWQWLNGKD